jgi:hypothetical protein
MEKNDALPLSALTVFILFLLKVHKEKSDRARFLIADSLLLDH